MARVFDGTNQRGSVALDLSFTNRAAVGFWLWWNSFANDNDTAVEFTADWVTGNGFVVSPNSSSGGIRVGTGHPTAPSVNAQAARRLTRPASAEWHHLLVVFDRSALAGADKVVPYLDGAYTPGTLESSALITSPFAVAANLNIMSRNGSTFFGAGRMQDLAVWADRLPSAGDAALMASGRSPADRSLSARPYAYWPMHEGSGAPAIGTRAITWTNGPTTAGGPARRQSALGPTNALALLGGAAIGGAGAPPPSGGSDGYRWRGAQRDRFRW